MKNTCKFVTFTISALIAAGSFVNATTIIDFEEVALNGSTTYYGVRENPEPQDEAPNPYTVSGFTFTATYRGTDWDQFHATNPNQSMSIPEAAISDPDHGGTAMVGNSDPESSAYYHFGNNEIPTLITITSDSPTFSLNSIDLGPQSRETGSENIDYVIRAYNASGLVDEQLFNGITTHTSVTFDPSVWKDLTRVEITADGDALRFGIDNVEFNKDLDSVPEPSSALIFGLAAFGFAARRRRN